MFRLSRVFCSRQDSDRMLALYALFGAIEQLAWLSNDPALLTENAQWWVNELQRPDSAHPVMRALEQTGVRRALPQAAIEQLLNRTLTLSRSEPPADVSALRALCRELYEPRLRLELALADSELELESGWQDLATVGGICQLIRDLASEAGSGFWWVPMSVLARLQKTRSEIAGQGNGLGQVLSEMSGELVAAENSDTFERANGKVSLHLQLYHSLLRYRLLDAARNQGKALETMLEKVRAGDVYRAWKTARKLRNLQSAWSR